MSIAIVTGGGRGIGRAIVNRLNRDGYSVITCGRGKRPVDLEPDVHWMQADVADPDQANALLAEAKALPGDITVLINNAGVQLEKTVTQTSDADWDAVIGVNCRGVFNMSRAVLPLLEGIGGSIINIGSISGQVADPCMALYNASKAFVHGLTRSIAVDHGPMVRCNTIQPGWIMTGMADRAFAQAQRPDKAREDALERHPAGRFGQPQDIAATVAWLASDEASFITGQCFTVDGGVTAASPLQPGLF